MKKLTIAVAIIITILCLNKETTVMIPKDSIRFRVIANSDNYEDQKIKKKVVSNLKNNITRLEFIPKDLSGSRTNIKETIPKFEKIIEETLEEAQASEKYSVDYGMNYFPEKEYKGVTYPEGDYESLVVTLGNGSGENFWCVLFPPLCLLDAEEQETEDVEYTSFVKEILDKYF